MTGAPCPRLVQAGAMNAVRALDRCGGVGSAGELLLWTTRRQLRRAVKAGAIVRLSRGRYVLPSTGAARSLATELTGVVCLRSAASVHGWALKIPAPEPEIAVRPNRNVSGGRWDGVRVCWLNLADDEVVDGVTTPLRTVIDCARRLPFDEALAVADSALRSGKLTREQLEEVGVRGAGADAVRRVLRHADARAANPFESVLRALCLEAGLAVQPQHPIQHPEGVIHPDLVCVTLGLVLEAESWTFHATRKAFKRDCARYNLLVLQGWLVLRFSWEHVMLDQAYVRWVLSECARRAERVEVAARRPRPA